MNCIFILHYYIQLLIINFFYQELPKVKWFCGIDCDDIHMKLQNLMACGEVLLSDSIPSFIENKQGKKGLETKLGLDIKWRVLNTKFNDPKNIISPLISKAYAIFHVSIGVSVLYYSYRLLDT